MQFKEILNQKNTVISSTLQWCEVVGPDSQSLIWIAGSGIKNLLINLLTTLKYFITDW